MEQFAPTIMFNGKTQTPTNIEWVLVFAIKGCAWAIEALPKMIEEEKCRQAELNLGAGI